MHLESLPFVAEGRGDVDDRSAMVLGQHNRGHRRQEQHRVQQAAPECKIILDRKKQKTGTDRLCQQRYLWHCGKGRKRQPPLLSHGGVAKNGPDGGMPTREGSDAQTGHVEEKATHPEVLLIQYFGDIERPQGVDLDHGFVAVEGERAGWAEEVAGSIWAEIGDTVGSRRGTQDGYHRHLFRLRLEHPPPRALQMFQPQLPSAPGHTLNPKHP